MFGNIQDANLKQSAQLKNSLVANGGIEVLLSIIRCNDPRGPQFDFDQNIFQKGAPEWTAEFVLQADATLALRRLIEVGNCERKTGPKRVHQAVLEGSLNVIVPHLYCTSCAAQYAAGALKLIAQYEMYRQNICEAGALNPLLNLLKADPVEEKSSQRHAAECLHLLSCSTVEHFEELGILEACLDAAMNDKVGEKPVLLSVLCAANITAGQDGESISKRMETVYRQVSLGVHVCRWLNTSLNDKGSPYFTVRCSQIDMLRSVCFLMTSEVGRLQLISAFIKEDGSLKKLTLVDILMKILTSPALDDEVLDLVLEIFFHMAFSVEGSNLLKSAKNCVQYLRSIADVSSDGEETEGSNYIPLETRVAATKIISVLSGHLCHKASSSDVLNVGNGHTKKATDKSSLNEESEDNGRHDNAAIVSKNDDDDPGGCDISRELPHVMISYSWAHQDTVVDICKHLKAAGITYWLDIEQMHGKINDRMAEAIESCGAVLIGVSSKYKLSANCRMEAEYSNASGKPIIPLMMETGYRADGWLGLLTAGKLWYGVAYDDANRDDNISSLIDVVKNALVREAKAMSAHNISRSLALFRKVETANRIVDLPEMDAIDTSCSTSDLKLRDGYPATTLPSEDRPVSLDAISVLFENLQTTIEKNLTQQLSPIVDSLKNIEERLIKLENSINRT